MNGRSVVAVCGQKMFVAFFLIVSIHRLEAVLDGALPKCNHKFDECDIKAVFKSIQTNAAVDFTIHCLSNEELSPDLFLNFDKIDLNGCETPTNMKSLGLRKISWRGRVKELKIEEFSIGSLEAGTFDGFSKLVVLTFQYNSIENLLSSCFRGLESLKVLRMMENNLKWLDAGVLGDLPALKSLGVHDKQHLLIANHQFTENQNLDNVKLEIDCMEMDPLEHLLLHVRNLSISVNVDVIGSECHQVRLNGYEKQWIVENLSLTNFSCGFVMENVDSVTTLKLIRAVQLPHLEFKLQNLRKLEEIALHDSILDELSLRGNLERLTTFDVSNNQMKSIDMKMFATLKSLKTINLKGNFLSKLEGINAEKFLPVAKEVKLLVDENNFDCSWLFDISSSEVFTKFVFETNFTGMNINGLRCAYNQATLKSSTTNESLCSLCFIDPLDNETRRELLELKERNFILRPEIFAIIVCAASLLGIAFSFISIHVHHKRLLLKQTPFYHLLRDSFVRPISDVRITLRRDFKEIISRNLPPTNYEHPISESNMTDVTEMTDLAANIYEEILSREVLTDIA